MTINICNDPHMAVLYLKWSADEFHKGNRTEGMDFFRLACDRSIENEQAVYNRMWTVMNYHGTDLEFGKKAFHDLYGYYSLLSQKTRAISLALRGVDWHELFNREAQVFKYLSNLPPPLPSLQSQSQLQPAGIVSSPRPLLSIIHRLLNINAVDHIPVPSSKVSQRRRAVQMYANTSRVLSWLVQDKQAHLIKREDGQLECLITDPRNRTLACIPIALNGHSREDLINFFSECKLTLANGMPTFEKVYTVSSRILTWLVQREQVHLINREDGQLECLVSYLDDRALTYIPIDLNGQSREEVITSLFQSEVILNDETPFFSKLRQFEQWPSINFTKENRELTLFIKDEALWSLLCRRPFLHWITLYDFNRENSVKKTFENGLLWGLYDRSKRIMSFAPMDDFTKVINIIRDTEIVRRNGNKFCLEDFNISINTNSSSKLLSVSIEKKVFYSQLDPSQTIDFSNWAITLIDSGRSLDITDFGGWAGHAMIAYEGVEDGVPFLHHAHLIADKVDFPQAQILTNKNVHIRAKSQTWIRQRRWVRRMLSDINAEVGKPVPFSFMGDYLKEKCYFNWFSNKESLKLNPNCLTWLIKKLSFCGIDLPKPAFLPLPNEYVSMINSNPSLVKINQIYPMDNKYGY